MTIRKSISISLPPELAASADRLLKSGRYGNFSEVIRAGLRLLEERELHFEQHRRNATEPRRETKAGTQGSLNA